MATFIQLFIDGLSAGSIYAALALEIVLVNQATGLINFAQGGILLAVLFVLPGGLVSLPRLWRRKSVSPHPSTTSQEKRQDQ